MFFVFLIDLSAKTSTFDSTASQGCQSYRSMFFSDFFIDLSAKTSSFESISGMQSSQKVIKSRCFIRQVHDKSKKHCAGVRSEPPFAAKTSVKRTHMIPWADPGDPADLVHGLQLGTSPTRAGGQDDVSLDKLPQINWLRSQVTAVRLCSITLGQQACIHLLYLFVCALLLLPNKYC